MELSSEDDKLTPRKRLGRSLRRLRESAGLSLRQLSEKVDGYSHSYLGRAESGEQLPSEALMRALDRFYGTGGTLVELWEMVLESLLFAYYRDVIKQEPKARRIEVFNTSLVTALLRTEEYARAHFRMVFPGQHEDELNQRVAIIMRRQQILESDKPPHYWAILDEAVLKRPVGGREVMCNQLRHVLTMAERERVTVQVLPFEQGALSMPGGSLTMHTMAHGRRVALIEGFDTGEATEEPDRLLVMEQRMDIARAMALPERNSLDLIRRYLKDYENG